MSITIGSIAPDFTLKDTNTEAVSLNSFRGKNVVLLFFPLANSGVCTKELCSMRDNMGRYSELNAQVLGVSVDSHFALKLWKETNQIDFPLLSDFNKEVAPAYGAFYDVFAPGKLDYKGVAKRSAFVIDPDGVVKYAEVLESAGDEPNYEAIQEALK
ncbi:MAG: redoxin domain-containing protein [Ignavibacteriaceae bacterium]|jgi:peroxiredoxin